MKSTSVSKRNLAALLAAFAALGTSSLFAQTTTLNWDADGGAGVGGTGAWDTTSTLWNTAGSGAANTIWTTGSGNSGYAANFGGTAGTVTVQGGGITTGILGSGNGSALNFDTGGYILSGGKITIDNTGGSNDRSMFRFNTAAGATTIINNAIDFIPHDLAAGGYNRLVQVRANDSITTFNGAFNIINSTGGFHRLDILNANNVTGALVNLNGVIGDAASAPAQTQLRISSGGATIANLTTRLNAVNLYEGGTIASGKVLVAVDSTGTSGSGGAFGANSSAGVSFGTGGYAALSTVSVLTDAAVTVNNSFNVGNTGISAVTLGGNSANTSIFGGNVDVSGANSANLAGQKIALQAVSGGTVTFSGLITDGADTRGIDKIGAGTVILSRAAGNTIDGSVNVVIGTLLVNNTSGSGTGTGAVTVGSAAGTLTGAAANATTNGSRFVNVTSTAGMVVGQTITGTGIAAGTFVEQIRSGTQIILSQNANSSANNQTLTLAASDATLGGSGFITGLVTTASSTSTITPGNGGAGTFALSGGLNAAAGATFKFELGTTSDLLALGAGVFTGSTAAGGLTFEFTNISGFAAATPYTLSSFASSTGLDYTDLTASIVPSGFMLDSSFGTGGFQINSGNLQVQFTTVPEPSTAALIGLGVLGMVAARRRRRSA